MTHPTGSVWRTPAGAIVQAIEPPYSNDLYTACQFSEGHWLWLLDSILEPMPEGTFSAGIGTGNKKTRKSKQGKVAIDSG